MKDFVKILLSVLNHFLVTRNVKTVYLRYKTILVYAPHPDDEIIGLGGLIIQTLANGGEVFISFLTDGESSKSHPDRDQIKNQRDLLTKKIFEQLNIPITNRSRLKMLDGGVPIEGEDEFSLGVEQIIKNIEDIKPDAVFATARSDFWPSDHVACSELIQEAVGQINFKKDVWFYWVWTWYHLRPWRLSQLSFANLRKIDISNELEQKQKLMDVYLKPLSPTGIPWSGSLPKSMLFPFTKPFEILERYE